MGSFDDGLTPPETSAVAFTATVKTLVQLGLGLEGTLRGKADGIQPTTGLRGVRRQPRLEGWNPSEMGR